MELVPSRNIAGDVGHRQILGNVCEKQIEALVSCKRGIYTESMCPNLQLKFHDKTSASKQNKQTKKKEKLKNDKRKYTNLGNELLDAGICWDGTSCKLRFQHELHHVHIFMKTSLLGASKDVAFVSKRAAFLLQGKERRELPLSKGVAINCGPKAEGVLEGATDGTTNGVSDRFRGKVGGSTGVFEAHRVTT